MHVVTRKHLSEAIVRHPDAGDEIRAWVDVVISVRWHNFAEMGGAFPKADFVDGYVIFDIRGNRYRLITVIHYAKTVGGRRTEGHIYIRSFLTHRQSDKRANWDRRFGTR